MTSKAPRVFISYSHDSPEHADRVLRLADRLRGDGVDAWIDQYEENPSKGWPFWMERQIEKADQVLMVCTETYRRRFDGEEAKGGLGVRWEGAILRGEKYRRRDSFVVPGVFHEDDKESIPTAVRDQTSHVLGTDQGYWDLYRLLTDQPETPAPELGRLKRLQSKARRSFLHGEPLAAPEAGDEELLDAYRDWAKKRFRYVNLIGLGQGDVRLDLDKIYVPLRLAEMAGAMDLVLDANKGLGVDSSASFRDDGEENLELHEIFRPGAKRHAVLRGEPGSGKTTALHKLHRICAVKGDGALRLGRDSLPVFLRLRTLTDREMDGELSAYLERDLREASGESLPEGVGSALTRHGHLLLLFDGLDEVPDPDRRRDALRHVVWQLRDLPGARAVISCRHGGWSEDLELPEVDSDYAQVEVRPLDDEQIQSLIENWHREAARSVAYYSQTEARAAADRLRQSLFGEGQVAGRRIKELVSTPLLLTLLCVVVMKGGEMPERRVEFFEEVLRVLLGNWRQQAGRKPPEDVDVAAAALETLAFHLHANGRKEDLKEVEALLALKTSLGLVPARCRKLFRWLWRDAGLLTRFNEREFGFPHLYLQEHLTARYLASKPEALDQIGAGFSDRDRWREVFLLLAGLPDRAAFGPLSEFLIRQGALETARRLFRECLAEARRLDLDPLERALGKGSVERQQAVLGLLAGYPDPAIMKLVERFQGEGTARSPDVATQAAAMMEAWRGRRPQPQGVFLAHSAEANPDSLERLRDELENQDLSVVNPPAWPSWRDAFEAAEEACAVLLPVGGWRLEVEARDVADLYGIPAWLVLLPGETRSPVPEELADLPAIELRRFESGELESLAAELRSYQTEEDIGPRRPKAAARGESRESDEVFSFEASGSSSGAEPEEELLDDVTGERFLPVPSGRFLMGGTTHDDEKPPHWVRLSGFWLAQTPVTNRQYSRFVEETKAGPPKLWRDRRFSGEQQPVVGLSWHDAVAYCNWLTSASPKGNRFQLPSEAQWEFAARGTDAREFPWGSEEPDERRADYGRDPGDGPAEVGSFPLGSGPFGHLDLGGGVWEWCLDEWEDDYSRWESEEPLDPVGRVGTVGRTLRGGSWMDGAPSLRSAFRFRVTAGSRGSFVGFRVCCVPPSA